MVDNRIIAWRSAEEFERLRPALGLAISEPRPLHLVWVDGLGAWVDERCPNDPPCQFHPDDDNGTHGGRMHVHECGVEHQEVS